MSPGFRHIEHVPIGKYADFIQVFTYPGGERRIKKDPPKNILENAFDELGTLAAVASAFGVSRGVVKRWIRESDLEVSSRPEVGLASYLRRRLTNNEDTRAVAQWLMDEGSVSVAFFKRGNYTILIVCGSMNDYHVLSVLSVILETPITSSKAPGATTLPMGALRVHSARAYALLGILEPRLVGLKAMETRAALHFFPPSGLLRGRHTTDEFLVPIWKDYALQTLIAWNSRRRVKLDQQDLEKRATQWVTGRIKRARRYVDAR